MINHPEDFQDKSKVALNWSRNYTLERFENEIQKLIRDEKRLTDLVDRLARLPSAPVPSKREEKISSKTPPEAIQRSGLRIETKSR